MKGKDAVPMLVQRALPEPASVPRLDEALKAHQVAGPYRGQIHATTAVFLSALRFAAPAVFNACRLR